MGSSANNNVWTGFAGDGDWSNPDNWSLLEVPTTGQKIEIGSTTSAPTVNVPNNYDADVAGDIANSGVIDVNSTGNATDLTFNGDVQLTGGGTVSLSDNANNNIYGDTGGSVLENVDNTIAGAGQITASYGRLSLINDSQGVIDGSATNNTLNINNISVTNDGLLEATGAGGLSLSSETINQSGGGTIEANGGNVYIGPSVDIVGGTFSTPNGLIESTGTGSTLDGSQTLPITIAAGATIQINDNANLTITGSIVDQGKLLLNSAGDTTDLIVDGATSLSGGGVVQLSDEPNNRIYGGVGGTVLTNVDDKIEGSGQIVAYYGRLTLVNDSAGVIEASGTSNDLNINNITVTNDGLVEAAGAGGLSLSSETINQSGGGTIEANGGNVDIGGGVDIVGGTFSAPNGLIEAAEAGSTFDGSQTLPVTVAPGATVQINDGQNLTITGSIVDQGEIRLNSLGDTTDLIVDGATSLSGGGVVQLSDEPNNRIYGGVGGTVLTNVDDKIEGSGQIVSYYGRISLVNDTTGVIDASGAANVLNINNITVTNDGLVEATGVAGLFLQSMTLNQLGGGSLQANGGEVNLSNGVDIEGGTLSASNGVFVVTSGGSTLDGSEQITVDGAQQTVPLTIAAGAQVEIADNQNLTVLGTLTNNGELFVDSTGDNTDLIFNGDVTLQGSGEVVLSDAAGEINEIYANVGSSVLDNQQTIEGAGEILSPYNRLALLNDKTGVIDATGAQALALNGIAVVNQNLLETTAGSGGLAIVNSTIDNTNGGADNIGEILATGLGTSVTLNNSDIIGGALKATQGGQFEVTGGSTQLNGTQTGDPVTLTTGSVLTIEDGQTLTLDGTGTATGSIVNEGVIALASNINDAALLIGTGGTVRLTGGGEISLSNSGNNQIYSNSGGSVLDNVDNTIDGGGYISSPYNRLAITNEAKGVIDGDAANSALFITGIGVSNEGLIEATGVAGLVIENNATITQSGAGQIDSADSNVTISGSTIVGGRLDGGVIYVENATMDGSGASAPVTIAAGTTVQIVDNNSLTLSNASGSNDSIVNHGVIALASTGDNTNLLVGTTGTVTLSGGGKVELSDSAGNQIYSNNGGSVLDNFDNTIEGAGVISSPYNRLSVTNEAQGVIDANATNNALQISGIGITNKGLIESQGPAALDIEDGATIYGSSGGLLDTAGGNVSISGSTIDGGTFEATGAGTFIVSNSTFDGSATGAPVTIEAGAEIEVADNTSLTLSNASGSNDSIVNHGVIALASTGDATSLFVGTTGTVTLSGGGKVELSDSVGNQISSNNGGSVLENYDNTIEGAGSIISPYNRLSMINEVNGVVAATYADAALSFNGINFNNLGTVEAENGATLNLASALDNISADPNFSGGSILTGGTYDVVDPKSGASTIAIAGNGAKEITTLAATVDLTGAGSNLTSNGVSLENSLNVVAVGGALNLNYGVNSASQQVFDDTANPFTIRGAVNLNGAVLQAPAIAIYGGTLYGEGAFNGAKAENAEVTGPIVNNGTIESAGAASAAGQPAFVVNGDVSGAGNIDIDGDSVLELTGASGAGQVITFGDNGTSALETLRIDSTSIGSTGAFESEIAGFQSGDAIDLANLKGATGYSYDGSTLTVDFASGNVALAVSGLGSSPRLSLNSDGANGTLITEGVTAQLALDSSHGKADTNDAELVGTAAPGSTVSLSEGGHPLGSAAVNAAGGWDFTPAGLADGAHSILATDLVDNVASGSTTVNFTLETKAGAPALSVVVDGGSNTPIGVSGAGSVAVSVTGLKADDNGTLTFSDGVAADNQTIAIVNGVLAQTSVNLSRMQDGPIASTLSVTDAANNAFSATGNTVTLDQGELQTWSADGDFSGTANPTGPWAYEYNNGTSEQLLTVTGQGNSSGQTPDWNNGLSQPDYASVLNNTSGVDYVTANTVYDPAGYLNLDPQSNKSVDVVFTAPTAGTYTIAGSFIGNDSGEQSHPVEIEVGGVSVWSSTISSFNQVQTFSLTETLSAGETVDFANETGVSPNNLSTGLAAVISTGKEQSQLSLAVDGGATTPVGQAGAGAVAFTVGGLESLDTGVVTFTDSKGGKVVVDITGTQSSYAADLAALADGPITSSMVVTSGAGVAFAPVAGNAITLDQALGEQAALALSVDGGASTPIGAAGASHVAFTVMGLQPGDHGVVTFTDADGHTVSVAVSGAATAYAANLSTLTDGTVTASLAVATDAAGNSFAPVAGNSVTLAQDQGEQAALALSVDGGSSAPIGAAGAADVAFAIAGLLAGDTGTVTFTDAQGYKVQVAVTAGQTAYTANLSGLDDGPVTATLAVATNAAGDSFAPVAGNSVTLAQDLSEQNALSLSVDGGASNVQITASNAAATPFSVAGLAPGDTGVVSFTDANGKQVNVAVAYGQTNYIANLSSLALGTITDTLSVGQYDFIDFTKNNNIQTALISQFPTGLFQANNGFATPFDITSDANGNNFNDSGQTITINVDLSDVTNVYTLMNAYSPPGGGTNATVEFIGSGGASETVTLVNGQQVRDFYQDGYANSINGTTTQNAFIVTNTVDGGGTGNVNDGDRGTYVVDEQDFALNSSFANQTLEQIVITPQGSGTPILLGVTAETGADAAGNSFTPVAGNSIDEIANPPQAKPKTIYTGISWGDVHLVTFDGLAYNFQAAGEFILAESTLASDSYKVEIRTAPYGNGSSVSVTTEVAAQVGADRVTFGLNRNDVVWVDGVGETLTIGAAVNIDNGAGTLEQTSANAYQITWSTGEALNVTDDGGYFSLSTTLTPGAAAGSVKGLLGSLTGQANDFQLADGTVIPQPQMTSAELYGEFADAWRIPAGTQGLFDYGANETTDNYTDLSFPTDAVSLSSLPQSVQNAAAAAVAAAGITDPGLSLDAELDLIVTGNLGALGASQNAQQSGVTTTQAQFTGSLTPPPNAGVSANAASVTESASGTTAVTFTAYLTSKASTDTPIAWSVIAPAGGDIGYSAASLAAFGGSLPSGVVTIAAGQTSTTFTVDVPNAALGTSPTGALNVLIGAPDNVPVFAPEAQAVLVNNQPVAGSPAEPGVYEVAGGGTLSQSGGVYTLNLGNVVQSEGARVQLGLTNSAAALADSLGGSVSDSGTGGFSVAGDSKPLPALAPGQSYQGLFVTVGTTDLGAQSETLTFAPVDENQTGYSADLTPVTIDVVDNVIAPAQAVIDPGASQPVSINLGAIRVGPVPTGAASVALTIENAAASGAAALDASVAGTAAGVTASGAINQLGAGQTSQNISVGLDASSGGVKYGGVALSFASDAGDGNTASLPIQSVAVSGTVYKEASIAIAPAASIIHVGDSTTQALIVNNTGAANGYSEAAIVTASSVAGSGIFSSASGATGDVLAGQSSSALQLRLGSTAQAGVYSGVVTADLETDGTPIGDGYGVTDLGAVSAPVTVTIDNYAKAEITKTSGAGTLTQNGNAYTLDLGAHLEGTGAIVSGFGVENDPLAGGPTDWLSGSFAVTGNSAGAFSQGSLAEFTNLSAYQSDTAPEVALSTAQAGDFSETVTLTPNDSNSSGYSVGLTQQTLTIEGKVIPLEITAAPVTADESAGGTTTVALTVTNEEPAGGDNLVAKIVGFTGAVQSASGQTTVAAGDTDNSSLTATFSTATPGNLTGDVEVDVTDNGVDLGTYSVAVAAAIDNPAVAEIVDNGQSGSLTTPAGLQPTTGGYTLDLGETTQGAPALIANLAALNGAASPSDGLNGAYSGPSGDPEYANGGFGAFSGFAAGQETQPNNVVELTTYKVGTFTEHFTLNPTETNSAGQTVTLAPETVTVTGTILPPPPPPPPVEPTAVSWGDVHITTFTGLLYNFQAEGEFTLAKSTLAGDAYNVQIRLAPWSPGASVSVITQAAAGFGADHVNFTAGSSTVEIDGQAADFSANSTIDIDNGAGSVTQLSGDSFRVNWATGETLDVTTGGSYINLSTTLGAGDGAGSVEGLLGADTSQATDFRLADGTVLTQPLTLTQLYADFADAWRVGPNNPSLMDYPTGEGTANFTDVNFPADYNELANVPADILAQAKALAQQAGITDPGLLQAAELDYIVTGDPNAIVNSQNAQQQGVQTTLAAVPTAPASTQLGVSADATSVVAVSNAPTPVTFTAYLTAAATTDTTVNWRIAAPDATDLSASLFGAAASGSVVIAAGQTSANFTIDAPQGALGSAASANLLVNVTGDSNNDAIFAPTAETAIVNAAPVAGPQAEPQFEELSGGGTLTQNADAYTLNLGDVGQGAVESLQLAILNAAGAGADNLTGTISDSGAATVTGDGGLPLIAAGSSYGGLRVDIATATTGAGSETITFAPTDENATGYSAPLATETLTIDYTVAPTVAVTIAPTDLTLANETATVDFSFSSAPVAFSLSDVTAVDGTLSNLTGGGTSYAATFQADTGVNTNSATVSVNPGSWSDASGTAGEGGSSAAFSIATLAPTVQISVGATQLTEADTTTTVTFTFDAAPSDFVLADATATGGTLSGLAGSGDVYTATFTASANTDLADATVSVAAGSYHAQGLAGAGATSAAFAVDTAAPKVTGVTGPNVIAGPGATIELIVSFSEAVSVAGGVPTLTLGNGGSASYDATATSKLAANQLAFAYTVGSGQDASGLAISGLTLNGATLADGYGNPAVTTGAFPQTLANVVVASGPALVLDEAQAAAVDAGTTKLEFPGGVSVSVADIAKNLAKLSPTQISELTGFGVTQIAATDAGVALTVQQKAALGAADITVKQPWSGGSYAVLSFNADGSTHDIDYVGVANKPYVRFDVVYGANGKAASETWYASGDVVYQSESWNSDGSYSITYTGSGTAFGAGYKTYTVNYSASGVALSESYSNGALVTWTYRSGVLAEVVVTGISGQSYVKTDTLYGNGTPTSETWYSTGDVVYQSESWNSDNSYSITYTGSGTAFGASYKTYTVNYSASGVAMSESYSNGALETWTYRSGVLAEVVVTGISGQSYVKTDTLYDNGKPTSETQYTALGAVLLSADWTWGGPNGSYSVAYTTNGTTFGVGYDAYSVDYSASGQAMSESWSNGASETWTYNPDGSYETLATPPAGAAYTLDAAVYSAARVLQADAKDLSDAPAGSLRLTANGATVSQGSGALSVDFGIDSYTLDPHTSEAISATGTNSDTFAFASGFGQTTLTGFAPASDTLDLEKSMFDQSWFTGLAPANYATALLTHATGTTSTVVADAHGDALTLLGVTSALWSSLAGDIHFT